MNYLEQLISEWYQYQGCFVKTNVRLTDGKNKSVKNELDVVAYNYKTKEFVHAEASTDTHKKGDVKRVKRFNNKTYTEIFEGIALPESTKKKIIKRVIFLHRRSDTTIYDKHDIKALNIAHFLNEMNTVLANTSIKDSIVPESFPLIRTIQIVLEEIRKGNLKVINSKRRR